MNSPRGLLRLLITFSVAFCGTTLATELQCSESDLTHAYCVAALSSNQQSVFKHPGHTRDQSFKSTGHQEVRPNTGKELLRSFSSFNRNVSSITIPKAELQQLDKHRTAGGNRNVDGSTASLTLDSEFTAYKGDYNGDGLTDLYLRSKPQIRHLYRDRIIPISVSERDSSYLLVQNSDFSFSVQHNVDDADLNFSSWALSLVEVILKDINLDANPDFVIKNFNADPAFSNQTDNQIVYTQEAAPPVIRQMDDDFKQFFTEIVQWFIDPFYFIITAIDNNWYTLEGGDILTGWFSIAYINIFYSYDNGLTFLDEDDDPNDPNNIPSFCFDHPFNCVFDVVSRVWLVYGTFQENITVVVDYENFNQDSIAFTQAAGEAFHDPNVIASTDFEPVELILEGKLGIELGDTLEGMLLDPLDPDAPEEAEPLPEPRRLPLPFPDPATDPNYRIENKSVTRVMIGRVGITICVIGITCTRSAGDPNEEAKLNWFLFGMEWAAVQLIEEGIDPNTQTLSVVIGESDGGIENYMRIPNYAALHSAIFLDFQSDQQAHWPDDIYVWQANAGWIHYLMSVHARFLDIGNDRRRDSRGAFYPCERNWLRNYRDRFERVDDWTLNHEVGPCNIR